MESGKDDNRKDWCLKMGDKTGIEWTDATWNPTTGCNKVSQGCKHCYADLVAQRMQNMKVKGYENGFRLTLHENRLDIPVRWKRPRMIFVNSMSDLFHEEIPLEFLKKVFTVMEECPRHTFQILTKRSEYLARVAKELPWPKNVWIGVSVENADVIHRIHDLKKVNTLGVRFLSIEPLLGPLPKIDFNVNGISWVIIGGESGPGARPMEADWVRDIRDNCLLDDVPFFFKQWGGEKKRDNGSMLDGKEWKEFPLM